MVSGSLGFTSPGPSHPVPFPHHQRLLVLPRSKLCPAEAQRPPGSPSAIFGKWIENPMSQWSLFETRGVEAEHRAQQEWLFVFCILYVCPWRLTGLPRRADVSRHLRVIGWARGGDVCLRWSWWGGPFQNSTTKVGGKGSRAAARAEKPS